MRVAIVIVALCAASHASVARADVYGYIDGDGITHLATEQLDDRYALFLKTPDAGKGSPSPASNSSNAANAIPDAAPTRSRLFQRLVEHPGIARYEPLIRAASARHGLDAALVKAMVAVESGFDPKAVSNKGAVGLMQVLPATGERYGVRADRRGTVDEKLADPVLNLEIGTRYLADLKRMFPGDPDLALAAYNAGENAVGLSRRRIPAFPETIAYVRLVDQFQAFYAPAKTAATADATSRERIRAAIPARRGLPAAASVVDSALPMVQPGSARDAQAGMNPDTTAIR